MHGTAHYHVIAGHFVEEDVLFEGTVHDEETPIAQARMSEVAARPKLRVLAEELAGGGHGIKVAFGHFPARVDCIPLELPLHVRDEIVGLVDAHEAEDFVRARTRSRIPSKSARVSGVTG